MDTSTKNRWVPCLLLDGVQLLDGTTTSYSPRLPGVFDSHSEAMDAAEKLSCMRPYAMGYSAKRVEVPHGF